MVTTYVGIILWSSNLLFLLSKPLLFSYSYIRKYYQLHIWPWTIKKLIIWCGNISSTFIFRIKIFCEMVLVWKIELILVRWTRLYNMFFIATICFVIWKSLLFYGIHVDHQSFVYDKQQMHIFTFKDSKAQSLNIWIHIYEKISIIKSYFNCITRCKYGKTCISQPKRTLHKSNLSIKCNAIKIVSWNLFALLSLPAVLSVVSDNLHLV